MRQTHFAMIASAALSLVVTAASATDIMSRDQIAYNVTVTTSEGAQKIVLNPEADIRGFCEGCEIMMEDGQSVSAKADDIVFIINGELSIHED